MNLRDRVAVISIFLFQTKWEIIQALLIDYYIFFFVSQEQEYADAK